MGADLYIKKISEAKRKQYQPLFDDAVAKRKKAEVAGNTDEAEKAQKLVEKYYNQLYDHNGYFRDSYNASSVMWQLGLSWWDDVGKMCTKSGNLTPAKSAKLLETIKERKIPKAQDMKLEHATVEEDGENSREEWRKYFVAKKRKLEKFLERAIEMGESIECSL